MASLVYNEFKYRNAIAEIDLDGDTIKARLLMTNTTCDTENDGIVTLSNFTTIDASDATGYADVTLSNKAVTKEDANDRAKFSSDNIVFTNLGGDATRDYKGVLLYKYLGSDSSNVPIAYIEFTNTVTKAATQITVNCPSDGWMYIN